eukprot:2671312-Pyramimonas_sp.AAC.1
MVLLNVARSVATGAGALTNDQVSKCATGFATVRVAQNTSLDANVCPRAWMPEHRASNCVCAPRLSRTWLQRLSG